MNRQTGKRAFIQALLMLCTFLLVSSVSLLGQETSGELNGVVKDNSGGVMPNATVTVTNKGTGRVYTTKTGMDGTYRAPNLAPGHYSVKFEMSGFAPVEVADVNLLLGSKLKVDGSLQVSPVEQTVQVIENAPQIDLSSTTIGHEVTAEEFDRLPKSRSFQSLLITSPSVNSGVDQYGNVVSIEGGFQVNGASAGENQFYVDGVSVTGLISGKARQNATFEFLQEVQVKTAGIEAEYGGAMGGVMAAVTKSGGAQFHGEAHYYFAGNGISAGPVKRLLLDPATQNTASFVQDKKQADNRNELGGSLGGPLMKDKMWFFVAASPQWRRRTNNYTFSNGAGAISQDQLYENIFAKLSYDPASKIRTNFTWLYTPTRSTGQIPAYNNGPNSVTSSVEGNLVNKTVGFSAPQTSYTGSVDFILSSKSVLTVKGGRFWDNYKDTGVPNQSSVVYQTATSSLPANLLATVPANLQGSTLFQNTPRIEASFHDLVTRTFVQADWGLVGNFMGDHDLKLGVGTMKDINNVNKAYPGNGYVYVYWGRPFKSNVVGSPCNLNPCTGTYGYYEVDNIGTGGSTSSSINNLYIQDKWRVRPRLTLNLGLRTESEKIPSYRPDVKKEAFNFGFGDKLAPRIGLAYDVLGNGNLKLSFSWGRFYDWVKFSLARGAFGGDFWQVQYRALDTPNVFNLGNGNLPGADLWNPAVANSFRDRRIPNFDTVIPGIKPMSTDLINVGADYQMGPHLVFSGYWVHNDLRRTIEDLGAIQNGNEVYYYANPGEGGATITPPSGATTQVIKTPKPQRTYDAVELSVTRRFSKGWFGSASYVWSRLWGNYTGLTNSDEIRTPTTGVSSAVDQQQGGDITRPAGNATRAWDIDEVLFDSKGHLDVTGRLPTDRPHAFKLYGSKTFKWGTEIGGFFSVSSGTPLSTYVNTINQVEVFVNGRGDLGRTPVLSQTDMMIAHEVKFGETKKLRFEFNAINLFNQKTVRHRFVDLNRGSGAPVQSSAIDLSNTDLFKGYDYNALIAATPDGKNPAIGAKDPRFGMNDLWNPGFSGRFGIKFIF